MSAAGAAAFAAGLTAWAAFVAGLTAWVALAAAVTACGTAPGDHRAAVATAPNKRATATPLLADVTLPPVPEPRDPDGEDDGAASQVIGPGLTALATARSATVTAIAAPEGAHPLVCDLTPFAGALYASFAVKPADLDGARIYRLDPATDAWSLMFDWDRGGAPHVTHEVGGQGITRVRAIDGRLHAADSDAPLYGGFGISDAPFEDYVFVSDRTGAFGPLEPGDRPPAGTVVLPVAFHVFDVIRYRGAIVASGGTIRQIDKGTRYPGGLFVGPPDSPALLPVIRPGEGTRRLGVIRTTYMHRFGGRLYVGFQNNERRIRWDLLVLTGDPLADDTPAPVIARVTPDGGWLTQRFASAPGVLYWIASGYRRDRRGSALFASTDGQRFVRVALPDGAGAPQDIAVVGDVRYVLTTSGLYRARGAAGSEVFRKLAPAPAGKPFGYKSSFCSAPLAVFNDALYAGSTRDGTIYRFRP